MNNNLEHKSAFKGYEEFLQNIDVVISSMDQKHYLERKLRFLLDVRGYFKTNFIEGNYIEFGSYRSEMQFAAYKIFKDIDRIKYYVGLDTFHGEPKKSNSDKDLQLYDSDGDFRCDYDEVNDFVKRNMNGKGVIVKGDFRTQETLSQLTPYKDIALSIIDCNLLSSVESALSYTLENIVEGGIIYFDDFFYNVKIMKQVIKLLETGGKCFVDHNIYPPFAKRYVVICK